MNLRNSGIGVNVRGNLEDFVNGLPEGGGEPIVLLLLFSGSPQGWTQEVIDDLRRHNVVTVVGTSFTSVFRDLCIENKIAPCGVHKRDLERMRHDAEHHRVNITLVDSGDLDVSPSDGRHESTLSCKDLIHTGLSIDSIYRLLHARETSHQST